MHLNRFGHVRLARGPTAGTQTEQAGQALWRRSGEKEPAWDRRVTKFTLRCKGRAGYRGEPRWDLPVRPSTGQTTAPPNRGGGRPKSAKTIYAPWWVAEIGLRLRRSSYAALLRPAFLNRYSTASNPISADQRLKFSPWPEHLRHCPSRSKSSHRGRPRVRVQPHENLSNVRAANTKPDAIQRRVRLF